MEFFKDTLENGVRLLTVPMPALPSATVTVWVGTGSRYETASVAGISHFLEHMVFKGSVKRPTAKDISEAVDALGAEFNAGTSKEWTNFYIKARSGVVDTAFDILSDMVLQPLLKSDEVEREKGVIVEEIGMYEDTPRIKVGDIFENVIFGKTPLGVDIIGTRESVTNLTQNDFVLYRESQYYPENILITVAGGVTVEQSRQLAKQYFGSLSSGIKRGKDMALFTSSQKGAQLEVKNKKTDQAHMIVGYLGQKRGTEDRYAESVLSVILGGGMSSRLFIEVRERRGLCYSVHTSADHYIDTGYMGTYVGCAPEKAKEALEVILEEHHKMTDSGWLKNGKELEKAKEFIKGHLALSLEDTHDVNQFFGIEELLLGSVRTPDDVMKSIDEVTAEQVSAVAQKFFTPERLNLAIIGPFEDSSSFEQVIKK